MPLDDSATPVRGESLSHAPRLAWSRVLIAALGLLACLVTGAEAFWRAQGFRPTVPETLGLWYFWRQQVYPADGKVIVLAGTSRISAGVSLATMRECFPDYRIVQLGIPGESSCIGLLKDLVDDPEFRGTVICELDTPLLERDRWDAHRDFRSYHPPTLDSLIDCVVKAWLQDRLVCLGEHSTLRTLIAKRLLRESRLQKPTKKRRTFFRELRYDFGEFRGDADSQHQETDDADRRRSRKPDATWRDFASDIRDINRLVERLHARGGRVVFLRAPSTGAKWISEQELDATPARWDRFAQGSIAVCIHFRNVPQLRVFVCPDGSHLDSRDAPQFTRTLVSILNCASRPGASTVANGRR
jgi:hypothetical protein